MPFLMTLAAVVTAQASAPVPFSELLRESAVVVLARSTKTRPVGAGRVATLEVQAQVKGSPAATVELLIEPTSVDPTTPGRRALYFLRRQSGAPGFTLLAGYASIFPVVEEDEGPMVYLAASQVDVGGGLGGAKGDSPSPWPLAVVLKALGAKPGTTAGSIGSAPTYETLEVACEHCVVAREVDKEVAPRALDCGVLRTDAGRELGCVLESLRAGRPFRAKQTWFGIEGPSEVAFFTGRDGGTHLAVHSDTSGGTTSCVAQVRVDACAGVKVIDGGRSGASLECEVTEPRVPTRTVCQENTRATQSLTAPRRASSLRCRELQRHGRSVALVGCLTSSGDERYSVTAPVDAGNYLCFPVDWELSCGNDGR